MQKPQNVEMRGEVKKKERKKEKKKKHTHTHSNRTRHNDSVKPAHPKHVILAQKW